MMQNSKPGDCKQDFLKSRETLTSELDKLPDSVDQHNQLLKKTSLLREQHKVSKNASEDSSVTAQSVRACMEIICNISELLELHKAGEGINPDELKMLKRQLETESTKLNMVRDYLNEACNPVNIGSDNSPDSDSSFSADNSYDSVCYYGK